MINSVFKSLHFFILLSALVINSAFGQFDANEAPIDSISVKKGFEVELLFTVPKERLGSWVNLCPDDKNRIIASDQFGGLYRFESPAQPEVAYVCNWSPFGGTARYITNYCPGQTTTTFAWRSRHPQNRPLQSKSKNQCVMKRCSKHGSIHSLTHASRPA